MRGISGADKLLRFYVTGVIRPVLKLRGKAEAGDGEAAVFMEYSE